MLAFGPFGPFRPFGPFGPPPGRPVGGVSAARGRVLPAVLPRVGHVARVSSLGDVAAHLAVSV